MEKVENGEDEATGDTKNREKQNKKKTKFSFFRSIHSWVNIKLCVCCSGQMFTCFCLSIYSRLSLSLYTIMHSTVEEWWDRAERNECWVKRKFNFCSYDFSFFLHFRDSRRLWTNATPKKSISEPFASLCSTYRPTVGTTSQIKLQFTIFVKTFVYYIED